MKSTFRVRTMGLTTLLAILVLIMLLSSFAIGRLFSSETTDYVYNPMTELESQETISWPRGSEPPLPVPSSITAKHKDIRLDLERISVHKYYIIHSVVYGDQSQSTYHLYLTDLTKQQLDKTGVKAIWLETSDGKKVMPIAQLPTVLDFPMKHPLGWRLKVVARFPYVTQRDRHNLVLDYNGQLFRLEGIAY